MAGLDVKSVSTHVEDLASGRTVEPGEVIHMTEKEAADPHNKRLLDEGILIHAVEGKKKEGGTD